MKTGLVSVSFRPLSPEQVVTVTKQAGLCGIEWGGDVHVPLGDVDTARRVGEMTRAAGLSVAAYGSYFRVGCSPDAEITPLLDTAQTLGAMLIRVWAYKANRHDTTDTDYAAAVSQAQKLCKLADARDINITFECHGGTLTEEYTDAVAWMRDIDHPRAHMYWQPQQTRDLAYNVAAAKALAPWVTNLHVFNWDAHGKYPLAQGKKAWEQYLPEFAELSDAHYALLEFMPDDRPESLATEAQTLQELLHV